MSKSAAARSVDVVSARVPEGAVVRGADGVVRYVVKVSLSARSVARVDVDDDARVGDAAATATGDGTTTTGTSDHDHTSRTADVERRYNEFRALLAALQDNDATRGWVKTELPRRTWMEASEVQVAARRTAFDAIVSELVAVSDGTESPVAPQMCDLTRSFLGLLLEAGRLRFSDEKTVAWTGRGGGKGVGAVLSTPTGRDVVKATVAAALASGAAAAVTVLDEWGPVMKAAPILGKVVTVVLAIRSKWKTSKRNSSELANLVRRVESLMPHVCDFIDCAVDDCGESKSGSGAYASGSALGAGTAGAAAEAGTVRTAPTTEEVAKLLEDRYGLLLVRLSDVLASVDAIVARVADTGAVSAVGDVDSLAKQIETANVGIDRCLIDITGARSGPIADDVAEAKRAAQATERKTAELLECLQAVTATMQMSVSAHSSTASSSLGADSVAALRSVLEKYVPEDTEEYSVLSALVDAGGGLASLSATDKARTRDLVIAANTFANKARVDIDGPGGRVFGLEGDESPEAAVLRARARVAATAIVKSTKWLLREMKKAA